MQIFASLIGGIFCLRMNDRFAPEAVDHNIAYSFFAC